jgi:hypothetical protein
MAENFAVHLHKLATFSGTVGGQLRQVLLYLEGPNAELLIEGVAVIAATCRWSFQ